MEVRGLSLGKQKGRRNCFAPLEQLWPACRRSRSELIPTQDGKRQRDPLVLAAGGRGMSTPRVSLVDCYCMTSLVHPTPSALDPKKAPKPPAPPTNKIALHWPPDCPWPFTNDIEGQGPADGS